MTALQNIGSSVESSTPVREPLLYRFEAKLEVTPIGIVNEGLRMTVSFDGTVTDGVFAGGRVFGVDPLVIRRDGIGVIDAAKTITWASGNAFEHVRGYCLPPAGMELPPLEALLEPGFQWPDLLFPIQGFSTFSVAHPQFAHLNQVIARIDGWANFRRGQNAVETRIVRHLASVSGPTMGEAAS